MEGTVRGSAIAQTAAAISVATSASSDSGSEDANEPRGTTEASYHAACAGSGRPWLTFVTVVGNVPTQLNEL